LSIVQFNESDEGQENDQEMVKNDERDLSTTSVGIVTNYKANEQNGDISVFVSLFISNKPGRTVAWVSLN